MKRTKKFDKLIQNHAATVIVDALQKGAADHGASLWSKETLTLGIEAYIAKFNPAEKPYVKDIYNSRDIELLKKLVAEEAVKKLIK